MVPGGPRRRPGLPRARAVLVPPRPAARTARRCPPTLALHLLGHDLDPDHVPDGTPGEWYLHLFASEQPDLNWDHPDVRREHEDILRFWFDRGAAGVRIDSAALLVKDPALPEVPARRRRPGSTPHRPRRAPRHLPELARDRRLAIPGTRILIGEVWLPDAERFAPYLRPDELHTAFNFDFLARPWDAAAPRASIDTTLAAHAPVGAPATWVLSNHDVTRPVTRFGREDSSFAFAAKRHGMPTDLELGRRRARAAALLVAALPGSPVHLPGRGARPRRGRGHPRRAARRTRCTPARAARTPAATAAGCRCRGRASAPPFGFSPTGATGDPWLPQPAHWADLTVEAQARRPGSMLNLYRTRCASGARSPASATARLAGSVAPTGVLAFARGDAFVCITNLPTAPVSLPADAELAARQRPAGRTAGCRPTPRRGCGHRDPPTHAEGGAG